VKNYGDKTHSGGKVQVALLDAEQNKVLEKTLPDDLDLQAGTERVLNAGFPIANPKKWNAEEPNLYTLLVTLLCTHCW
jgi:beta-galactosidase